ncbi:MAG: hypothetical protein PUD28_07395, partial [Lactobacillus sp.]|nr:hypothetical protein [Lactobacillus sp.]
NALPVEICVDGINGKRGKFMEIKEDAFFKWIGEPNPYTRDTESSADEAATESETDRPAAAQPPKKKKGFWARLFG